MTSAARPVSIPPGRVSSQYCCQNSNAAVVLQKRLVYASRNEIAQVRIDLLAQRL